MTSYVALLRGVNVGGSNKVPMADLRSALEAAGFARVRTYIQSGNVVLDTGALPSATVAERVRQVITDTFDLDIPTTVLDAPALAQVVDRNPFADESDPRRVHVFFLPAALDAASIARVTELQSAALAKGARDAVTTDGSAMYLHTPDGFGTSDLAKALSTRGSGIHRSGTARNWATVSALHGMCSA